MKPSSVSRSRLSKLCGPSLLLVSLLLALAFRPDAGSTWCPFQRLDTCLPRREATECRRLGARGVLPPSRGGGGGAEAAGLGGDAGGPSLPGVSLSEAGRSGHGCLGSCAQHLLTSAEHMTHPQRCLQWVIPQQ